MKDEKEMIEMLLSKKAGCADFVIENEELEAAVDRMIKDFSELSPNEKVIIEKIREVLEKHNLKYSYDEDEPKHIELGFSMENKPFIIHVILQNGMVIFRLSFPFRVQTNAYPLMCMFMAEFNENNAFSRLNLDPDDGELTMEYTYMLENPVDFDEKYFWIYMSSLIHPALEIYTKAAHLSVGMVSGKERIIYKKLLKMALETINGDFDDDNVSYGIKTLRAHSFRDHMNLFGKSADKGKTDDADSDDEDISTDFIRSLRRKIGIPSFEEFMRMKAQAERSGEKETSDQPTKPASVLSMFARKDEDNEDITIKIGGNEDE